MTNPSGVKWEQVALGDVVEPLTTTDPRKQPEESFEYIDVSSVSRITHSIHATSPTLGCDAPSRARRLVRAGDVLFATIRPTLQRIAIVPAHLDQAICSTGYFVLRPKSNINGRFLFYCLFSQSFSDEMALLQRGANYPAVSDRDVREHLIHLPPLAEQKQIVAVLDEALAAIATATANTKKNIANVKELFDSELHRVFQPPQPAENSVSDVAGEWKTRNVGDVCILRNGRAYNKSELLNSGQYPVLRVGNLFTNKHWYYSNLELNETQFCNNGDLLYAWSASFGPRIWEGSKTIFHYHIWRIDFNQSHVTKKFLFYWLEWDAERIKKDQGAGTTMIHVSMKSMNKRKISYPSILEQKRIATFLDKLSAEKQTLVETYKTKIHSLTELKQSLLHQAFTGELTSK